jgi:MoaA/NifB/PqqE/SkfB family radical SAM enzyme
LLQISGSGLVAPCGMLFNERYKKFHIGNIVQQSFKDILHSNRYWEVMNYLASPKFDAQKMCGALCLQHKVNEYLDEYKKGRRQLVPPTDLPPMHQNFV